MLAKTFMFMPYISNQMSDRLRNICILLMVLLNAGCDQLTKNAVRENLDFGQTVQLIGSNFILLKTENSGAFLSAGDHLPAALKFIFLMLLPLIALIFGVYFLLINYHLPKILIIGVCFIIGGGLGNLYDRIFYGTVTDFLHIDFYFIKTGIFNFADVSILIGMGMLLINVYLRQRQNMRVHKEETE